jgi:hypothetical protein
MKRRKFEKEKIIKRFQYKYKSPDIIKAFISSGGRGTRTPTGLRPPVFKTGAIPLCDSSIFRKHNIVKLLK